MTNDTERGAFGLRMGPVGDRVPAGVSGALKVLLAFRTRPYYHYDGDARVSVDKFR